jgi:hypothetical protein
MAAETITCPHCHKKIALSKALTGPIEEKLRRDIEAEARRREKALSDDFERRLADERRVALNKAKKEVKTHLSDLEIQLGERDQAIEQARRKELELLKKQRELEDKQKTVDLQVARKVAEQGRLIEKAAVERLQEQNRLKDLEKDKQLSDLRRQIDDLKRKAEQGSQQTQGEAVELDLEATLRAAFPQDSIEPVAKGVRGADVVQGVNSPTGQSCGSIIWEFKNAKAWSDGWLQKLRDDQRAQGSETAILVSVVLPNEVKHFGLVDGVWVADTVTMLGLATVLRSTLLQVALAGGAAEGKSEKMEMLYAYLSGTTFKQKVEAIVESFVVMKDDLDRERRAMETLWSKREKQLTRVILSVGTMYGDMQGIIGATLPDIAQLKLEEDADRPLLGP